MALAYLSHREQTYIGRRRNNNENLIGPAKNEGFFTDTDI